MSDFLLNLARRSAGLAPIVGARVGPPAPAPGRDSEPAPPAAGVRTETTRAAPPRPVETLAPRPMAEPTAAPRAIPMAAPGVAATPAVQRMPAAPAAAEPTASAPARSVAPAAAPAVTTPPAHVVIEPRAVKAAPRGSLAESPVVAPVIPGAEPHPIVDAPSATAAVVPAGVSVEPRSEETPARPAELSRIVEIVREERSVLAPSDERTLSEPPLPVASVEPAPVRMPPRASEDAARVEPEPERLVHVRIDAIEIHAAVPEPASTRAHAPPPSAAPAGGFDEFARLRSYAPWSW